MGDEHVVLLQRAEPMLLESMRGLEAVYRSTHMARAAPVSTESKTFHNYLTVRFRTLPEAAEYTASFASGAGIRVAEMCGGDPQRCASWRDVAPVLCDLQGEP